MTRRFAANLAALVLALGALATGSAVASAAGLIDPGMEASLQAALDKAVARKPVPGISASIVLADGSRWDGVSGVGQVGPGAWPITSETPFVIGSITKTFVAATVLQLAEEGMLDLDGPLGVWLPDFPNARNITLRHLLSHTSGVMDYFVSGDYSHLVFGRKTHHWTTDEILALVGPPDFPPGSDWNYSNTNYVLLGLVVEAATGDAIGTQIQDRFLTPLGMGHTWFQDAEPAPLAGAYGYLWTGHDWHGLADATNYRPHTSAATVAWAAGAMVSTAHDLSIWARTLYGGRVLAPESLAQMVAFNADDYGLGAERHTIGGRETWGHNGSLRGFEARMRYLPSLDAAVVVLSDRGRWPAGLLTAHLAEIVFREVYPDTTAPVTTAPTIGLRVGSQVARGSIPVRIRWTTEELESGVADTELRIRTDGGSWQTVTMAAGLMESFDLRLAPGHEYAFAVRAVDIEANVGRWAVSSVFRPEIRQESHPTIIYGPDWTVSRQVDALGRHLTSARTAGSSASITVNAVAIGWISDLGRKRGVATPVLDGTEQPAVDLRSSEHQSRILVYAERWEVASAHSLDLIVAGTLGRPRVDLDAIVSIGVTAPPPEPPEPPVGP